MFWEGKGEAFSDRTVELAAKRARELNIEQFVVASKMGRSAEKLVGKAANIVCVTYHQGFKEPGKNLMSLEQRSKLEKQGVKLLTTTHLLAGVDRAFRYKFGGIYPAEIMAYSLRMLGQGVKVCVEISSMALDAGLIPYGEDILTLAGSGNGVDTALVIRPAHSTEIFETKIKEIICKPREW